AARADPDAEATDLARAGGSRRTAAPAMADAFPARLPRGAPHPRAAVRLRVATGTRAYAGCREGLMQFVFVIPAKAGLRLQDCKRERRRRPRGRAPRM